MRPQPLEAVTDADALGSLADLVTPMALRVAATLRVADGIRDGLATSRALAAARGVAAGPLDLLLRHLAGVGVVTRDDTGTHALTPLGAVLCDDHPAKLRARLDCTGPLGRAELSLSHLLHSVTTGDAAFPLVHGRDFWDDLASDPVRQESFDREMGRDAAAWAPAIAAAYPWHGIRRVVDVGGGEGALVAFLLRANPGLRGTVLDQAPTAAAAVHRLSAAGVADRGDAIAGSFFDPLPAGADVYLLCAVLHNWPDHAAGAILRRCAAAVTSGARVLVVEKTGAGGLEPSTAMSLRVLAWFGARERTAAEIVALAEAAGLRHVATHPAGELSVVELVAPDTWGAV